MLEEDFHAVASLSRSFQAKNNYQGAPMKIPVNVKSDHIEALTATKKPLAALSELIWNALDSDSDKVSIRFDKNSMGGIDQIRVTDEGTGIPYKEAQNLFGSLGGSWKAQKSKTASGRALHGKSGKGRFKAFALGQMAEWNITGSGEKGTVNYSIKGSISSLDSFDLTNPVAKNGSTTGTEVVISNLHRNFTSLTSPEAPAEITYYFAAYLSEYPGISIDYNGEIIDPADARVRLDDFSLGKILLSNGKKSDVTLTVIEWKEPQERALHLCDSSGISLHQVPPGIQAPGFNFTAYLKSDAIRELDKQGLLVAEDLHQDVSALIAAAKGRMREHFRARAVEHAAALLQEWKKEKVYPYEGAAKDNVEEVERQVFDVLAVSINSYSPDFEDSSKTNKRITFDLIKHAIKENPESLNKIFQDVLKLPKELQDNMAELLKKVSLSSIITSTQLIANRLDFVRSLELLLFDKDSKKELLERDQLHKVLAKETWIFGEEFHLSHNEATLNEVLDKHLKTLRKEDKDGKDVKLEDGSTGRLDLLLARSIPQSRAEEREYLVVELKRPSKKIDTEVLSQIKDYARAVAKDERFKDTNTRWIFWAVSNEMNDDAYQESHQRDRAPGLVYDDNKLNITVWAKTWGQIIQECKGRLNFFQEKLNYEATQDSAVAYLKKTHEQFIPPAIKAMEPKKEDGAVEDLNAEEI